MELIFEIITDLIIDGTIAASKNKKVSKPIRYLLIFFIVLFFILVVGTIIGMGIYILKDDIIAGVTLIVLGSISAVICIIRFRETYISKKNFTSK